MGLKGETVTREEVYELLHGVELTGIIRRGESGMWIGYCQEIPEARTQGATEQEVEENLHDAVGFVLEDYSREELEELRDRLADGHRKLITL
jgi:predicted RNase H-like HicB family nuclease